MDVVAWLNVGGSGEGWQYRAMKDRGRRRVTELADQKEMITDSDRNVER